MFGTDAPGSVTTMPTLQPAGTSGWATDGDILSGLPPTEISAESFNIPTAELINLVLDAGLSLNKQDLGQVSNAVQIVATNIAYPIANAAAAAAIIVAVADAAAAIVANGVNTPAANIITGTGGVYGHAVVVRSDANPTFTFQNAGGTTSVGQAYINTGTGSLVLQPLGGAAGNLTVDTNGSIYCTGTVTATGGAFSGPITVPTVAVTDNSGNAASTAFVRSLFPASLGGESGGWQEFAGGLIIQWIAIGIAAGTTQTVTLPRSFPNGPLGVSASFGHSIVSGMTLGADFISNSQLTVTCAGGSGTEGCHFIAFGF